MTTPRATDTGYAAVFAQYQLLRTKMLSLCSVLDGIMYELQYVLSHRLEFQLAIDDVVGNSIELQDFENILYSTKKCLEYTVLVKAKLTYTGDDAVLVAKVVMVKEALWRQKLKLMHHMCQLVYSVLPLFVHHEENQGVVNFMLRLCNLYNEAIRMDKHLMNAKSNKISSNTYPTLVQPPKKIEIKALLQAVSKGRAEYCCHSLISCLLTHYTPTGGCHEHQDSSSDSSEEIYRALTRHMTPPVKNKHQTKPVTRTTQNAGQTSNPHIGQTPDKFSSDSELNNYFDNIIHGKEADEILFVDVETDGSVRHINDMIDKEEMTATRLLRQANQLASSVFEKRVTASIACRLLEYYSTALWAEVGVFLEHIVIWWGSAPLAARPPSSSQHLREWISQQRCNGIPEIILTSLNTFADTLGCHVTTTSWDQQFRKAVVGATMTPTPAKGRGQRGNKSSVSGEGTETGRLFADVLYNLVSLSNQCEVTSEFISGAPAEELPLVEQIPVLHRLDHSIHTTRLWAANETRKLANDWNVGKFFLVTHKDITSCLDQLSMLKLPNPNIKVIVRPTDVHVSVCVNLKEKLLSEIKVNIQKLKCTTQECIDVLAVVCRTHSLANLTLLFPRTMYWQRPISQYQVDVASKYVTDYLERILLPVLEASEDPVIGNLVLKIMCEAWLDHIYASRVHFSHGGAMQLLRDFASVAEWLEHCPKLSDHAKRMMSKHEVLRQCEGVGRLLLRSPDEHIVMGSDKSHKAADASAEGEGLMPPEMFVPNQQQWLELRATKRKKNCASFLMCCTANIT